MTKTNDVTEAVPKLCVALETHRRMEGGRNVRSAAEFRSHYFPYGEDEAEDRIFPRLPRGTRGPIIASLGICGTKAATKANDAEIRSILHTHLKSEDVTDERFEECLAPETLMAHADMKDWWTFYRGGRIDRNAAAMILNAAAELALLDADWFLSLFATTDGASWIDMISLMLDKKDLVAWISRIAAGGDGSERGVLQALGWDALARRMPEPLLFKLIDALALKIGLASEQAADPPAPAKESVPAGLPPGVTPLDGPTGKDEADDAIDELIGSLPPPGPSTAPSGSADASEEPEGEGDRPSVAAVEVDDDEIDIGDEDRESVPTGPVSIVETGSGPTEIVWGEHAPDPERSRREAEERARASRGHSSSSLSSTPTPTSPRAQEIGTPRLRPPSLPVPPPSPSTRTADSRVPATVGATPGSRGNRRGTS